MEVWMGGALGLAVGCIVGAVIVYVSQKAQAGGKTVGQIQSEFKEYKQDVQAHFGKTSDLFRDMTHRYRELYDHLATGAQSLCEIAPTTAALDIAERELLPGTQHNSEDGNGNARQTDDVEQAKAGTPVSAVHATAAELHGDPSKVAKATEQASAARPGASAA